MNTLKRKLNLNPDMVYDVLIPMSMAVAMAIWLGFLTSLVINLIT